jgi:hypothetical protein
VYAVILLVATPPPTPGWNQGWGRGRRMGMSALLVLVFLARTDAALLIACLGVWTLAEQHRARDGTTRRVVDLVELFALPGVVLAGYLAYNRATFGTPVQVSGLVKRAPLTATSVGTMVVCVGVAVAVGATAFRREHERAAARPSSRFPRAGSFGRGTGWFASFCVLVIGYYNVAQTQQWLWYYCPAVLYLIILFLLAVADVLDAAAQAADAGQSTMRATAPVIGIFVLPLLIALVFEIRGFTDPTLLSIQRANRDSGEWIRQNLGEDAVLASWDAGVEGYFSHRRIINIDGVVNSYAYYEAMQHGTVAMFLRCRGLGFVVNHGVGVGTDAGDDDDLDIRNLIRDIYGQPAADASRVIERVPFDYSGTSNNGGFEVSGTRPMAVRVYEIPRESRGPRPGDRCDDG